MKLRKVAKAMDIPRLSRRGLEQAGDLGQPSRGEARDVLRLSPGSGSFIDSHPAGPQAPPPPRRCP